MGSQRLRFVAIPITANFPGAIAWVSVNLQRSPFSGFIFFERGLYYTQYRCLGIYLNLDSKEYTINHDQY